MLSDVFWCFTQTLFTLTCALVDVTWSILLGAAESPTQEWESSHHWKDKWELKKEQNLKQHAYKRMSVFEERSPKVYK